MTRPREGQTFDGGSRFVRYVNFVKLPHTVFALPFALERFLQRLGGARLGGDLDRAQGLDDRHQQR